MQVRADQVVDGLVRVGDVAVDLRDVDPVGGEQNGRGTASPGWSSVLEKSIVRPLSRHGVPVLNRASRKPQSASESLSDSATASPARPPLRLRLAGVHHGLEERARRQDDGLRPVQRARRWPDTPVTRRVAGLAESAKSSRTSASTNSCRSVRFGCSSTHRFIVNW